MTHNETTLTTTPGTRKDPQATHTEAPYQPVHTNPGTNTPPPTQPGNGDHR